VAKLEALDQGSWPVEGSRRDLEAGRALDRVQKVANEGSLIRGRRAVGT
jgi:hypothetical protein